ncbi:MAG: cob(I)yrinic acid a,c-diamide adenosyltransferase [Candidatus Micrarchaeota archaeon]
MPIYTKTGDSGETSLYGGKRVPKHDLRIRVYGAIDELSTVLGIARAKNKKPDLDSLLKGIQSELFIVGADISSPETSRVERVTGKMVERLENEIDRMEAHLPKLAHFILPSGCEIAATLHFARAVCRRAERRLVELNYKEPVNAHLLMYVNRLSDLLFVLARHENRLAGAKEEVWNA